MILIVVNFIHGAHRFTAINGFSWILPWIIVVPLDTGLAWVVIGMWPATGHTVGELLRGAIPMVGPDWLAVNLQRFHQFIDPGLAGWTNSASQLIRLLLEVSIEVRLLVIAGYILVVAGFIGVMEAVKHGVDADPFTYWSIKVGIAGRNFFRAIKPLVKICWAIDTFVLRRLVPVVLYATLLAAFYVLVIGPVDGTVTVGQVFTILLLIGFAFVAVPLFVHSACEYELEPHTFNDLTFRRMTNAHANVLLWVVFSLLIGSFILRGMSIDYSKAVATTLLLVGAVGFLVSKTRQLIKSVP